ncbi:MAG: AAA family ATPase [Paenibacillus sp.]|nr:AAA family ATPase [Paenibacillus sp.]
MNDIFNPNGTVNYPRTSNYPGTSHTTEQGPDYRSDALRVPPPPAFPGPLSPIYLSPSISPRQSPTDGASRSEPKAGYYETLARVGDTFDPNVDYGEIRRAFLASEPPCPKSSTSGEKPERVPVPQKAPVSAKPRPITRVITGDRLVAESCGLAVQRRLCGPLWYEGEICILFADTNVGKSLLAVQIADMIAHGRNCATSLPELRPETDVQPVIYADFELSLGQFARRYSCPSPAKVGERIYHDFGAYFTRVELYYDAVDDVVDDYTDRSFADQIISDLEARVVEYEARVLIIDNITFMATSTETAADAMPLMKRLVALKKRHGLSILLLAHTPKRCLSNPLTRNDLQGSKMLINFADSAFAIGESTIGKDVRYIKQIKQRNCEQFYSSGNVLQCLIGRIDDSFIGLTSTGTSAEEIHLQAKRKRRDNADDRIGMARMALELKEQGLSTREIAERLKVSKSTVHNLLSMPAPE